MTNRDKLEGKAKEMAGKVTGDDELENEGRAQHAKGDATERIEDAKASVSGAVEAAKDAISGDDEDEDEDEGPASEDTTDR